MCITQFLQTHQFEINLLSGFVIGLATGYLTSYLVTRHFRGKDEKLLIIDKAKILANNCHALLDIVNRLIMQLSLRKNQAYYLIQSLDSLTGETKRRTKNQRTTEISLSEIQKETLDHLCTSIYDSKLPKNLKAKHKKALPQLVSSIDTMIDQVTLLWHEINEAKAFDDFHFYIDQVEHTLGDLKYEEFIEKLDKDDHERYRKGMGSSLRLTLVVN